MIPTCRVLPADTARRARDAAKRIAALAEEVVVARAAVERAHDACWRVPLDHPDRAETMAHALASHRAAQERLGRLQRRAADLVVALGGY